MAMASAPALRSSLTRSCSAAAVDRPADRHHDTAACHRGQPGVRPDPLELGAQVVDRDLAARLVLGQRGQVALQGGDLAPKLVVAPVQVGHEDRQVLRRELGERRTLGLRPQLDDDEDAQQEGDRRDRDLVAPSLHPQPPGVALGPGSTGRDGRA